MKKTEQEKEAIIAEYLMGETTYRKLEKKHGVDFRLIHSWVTKFHGKSKSLKKTNRLQSGSHPEKDAPLSSDVKKLQAELRKAQLYNKLLNTMMDIAEDELKIDIRKKFGTERSKQ